MYYEGFITIFSDGRTLTHCFFCKMCSFPKYGYLIKCVVFENLIVRHRRLLSVFLPIRKFRVLLLSEIVEGGSERSVYDTSFPNSKNRL